MNANRVVDAVLPMVKTILNTQQPDEVAEALITFELNRIATDKSIVIDHATLFEIVRDRKEKLQDDLRVIERTYTYLSKITAAPSKKKKRTVVEVTEPPILARMFFGAQPTLLERSISVDTDDTVVSLSKKSRSKK